VGGGLGWFYYLYHKNINKTLILQNFCDDFCEELQTGDKFCEEGWNYPELRAPPPRYSAFAKAANKLQSLQCGIQSYELNSSHCSTFVRSCKLATDFEKIAKTQLV
jgi:hypothetical protein